jgi:hypothetical protein
MTCAIRSTLEDAGISGHATVKDKLIAELRDTKQHNKGAEPIRKVKLVDESEDLCG